MVSVYFVTILVLVWHLLTIFAFVGDVATVE